MSYTRLVLKVPQSVDGFNSICNLTPGGLVSLNIFQTYFNGVIGGSYSADCHFKVGCVHATGTITIASTGPTNNETMTVAGQTFTAKTSGATGQQFNINASPTIVAANIAAAINAAPSMAGVVTATSALGVVTLSAAVPGAIGNGLVAANVDLANTTIVSFANGTDGDAYNVNVG